jgi:hypothetical protein
LGAEAEEAQGQEEAGGGQEDRVKGCRSPTEIQGEEEKESEGDRKHVFVYEAYYRNYCGAREGKLWLILKGPKVPRCVSCICCLPKSVIYYTF